MKPFRVISFLVLLSGLCTNVRAQQAYLAASGVAVFVPPHYDAAKHLPSPIFVRELVPEGNLLASWRLRPEFSTQDGKSVATVRVDGDVDFYGTGEVYGDLIRNGETIGLWNKDNGAYAHDGGKRLYQSHPWVLGVCKDGTAFGIIADNTWKSKLTPVSTVRFESEGPAFRVVVIEKNSPQEVLETLGRLSGTIDLPPLWALGYHQCRYSYNPDTRAMEVADGFREHKIPCDAIWLDIDYMDGYRIFTFSPTQYPNPKKFNDYLHSKKFKSVYMIDPGAKVDSNYFVDQQGLAKDYFVRKADGSVFVGPVWPGPCHFPDFTRPEVRTWWGSLYKDFMATGADGIWNDMNEPALSEGVDGTMPEDNVHLGGDGLAPGPHLRYHNVFGYFMVKASHDGILQANPDKRPFVLSRANFLGGQRYAATWTGDNCSSYDHMRKSIPMTLNMGLTGQPFNGPDIGGFLNACTPELLAHWMSIGIYFPFVRNHSCIGTPNQEPYAMGEQTEQVCRTAINRRYRLLPYIYTLFHKSSVDGQPVMRPVFFADIKDTTLRKEQQAFLLGQDLLIIPRWAKDAQLPKGNWNIVSFDEAADHFQAYVAQRPGTIVPMANLYQNTEDYRTDSLTLLVNPADGAATGTLYEDGGNGFGYRHGDYAVYKMEAATHGKKITVSIRQVEGKRHSAPKTLRVGIVTDGRVTYSPWTRAESVTVKTVADRQPGIDKSKLEWIKLPE